MKDTMQWLLNQDYLEVLQVTKILWKNQKKYKLIKKFLVSMIYWISFLMVVHLPKLTDLCQRYLRYCQVRIIKKIQ
ncbi:unnamed protein product [Paramecium octaurelia]|uniref:Uncharacterized protein n=1 Tax=Paramecium octaurelia TaxID=43137 RepID=A0A8S1VJ52_PAROT|nr:unnamed protein product [Paramecium octaurelia]